MPKVSVIIPVYNTEQFLRKCLDSVCNQTLSDIEIICINDCSTDNSLEVLKKYPVKIIDLPENKGAAYARNRGIEAATGEYIGFVDSDDFVDLDFYEKLYNKAIETGAEVAKGTLVLYNPETDKINSVELFNINEKIKKNKAYFYFTFTTGIFKRNLITKNNIRFIESLSHFEDPPFTIKLALFYNKVEIVDNANYFYVNNPKSVTRNVNEEHVKNTLIGSLEIMDFLNKYCTNEEHYSIIFNFLLEQFLIFRKRVDLPNIIDAIAIDCISKLLKLNKYPKQNNNNITFISVVNNLEQYREFISNNVFIKFKKNIQLVNLDNTKENVFISKRYNEFLNNYDYSKDSWFIFCHPDWEIMEDIEPILEKLDKNKIYGPIGSILDFSIVPNKFTRFLKGSILEKSRDKCSERICHDPGINWSNLIVDTLDCQAIIIHSSLIKKYNLRFDENLEWDLYVEDFCINAKVKHDIESQVVKIECCHHSDAGFKEPPQSYWNMLEYVNKKYPDKIFAGTVSPIGGGKKIEKASKSEVCRAIMFQKLRKNIKNGSACCV